MCKRVEDQYFREVAVYPKHVESLNNMNNLIKEYNVLTKDAFQLAIVQSPAFNVRCLMTKNCIDQRFAFTFRGVVQLHNVVFEMLRSGCRKNFSDAVPT